MADPGAAPALDAVRIGIVSISDRASSGVYADQGLPALQSWLTGAVRNPIECLDEMTRAGHDLAGARGLIRRRPWRVSPVESLVERGAPRPLCVDPTTKGRNLPWRIDFTLTHAIAPQ